MLLSPGTHDKHQVHMKEEDMFRKKNAIGLCCPHLSLQSSHAFRHFSTHGSMRLCWLSENFGPVISIVIQCRKRVYRERRLLKFGGSDSSTVMMMINFWIAEKPSRFFSSPEMTNMGSCLLICGACRPHDAQYLLESSSSPRGRDTLTSCMNRRRMGRFSSIE